MSSLITVDAGNLLDSMAPDIAPLLRENGQSFDRLKSVFMIAVMQEPKILACTPESLRREISKCASDGLVPDSKEAAILPYRDNKNNGVLTANYQPMVFGVIKRMRELGDVFEITCNLVYEMDEYTRNMADPYSLVHRSPGLNKPRGDVIGGYVFFRDDQKRILHFEEMPQTEMAKVRAASKAPDSPAWKTWTEEMYKKAVLRRGSKYISIDNDKIRALLERPDAMFDFTQTRAPAERFNPFTGELIEQSAAAPALSYRPQAAMNEMPLQPERGGREVVMEPAAQASKEPAKQKAAAPQKAAQPQETGAASEVAKEETKKPMAPPSVPGVSIEKETRDIVLEGVCKLLAIGMEPNTTPHQRQEMLRDAAPLWKEACPTYSHRLIKACVDMTNWAVLRQVDGLPWAAEHAVFCNQVSSLFDVKRLPIPKYP